MTITKCGKRQDYLSWDEYFMAISLLSAQRSKDPNTQVGACIVNPKKKIVGVGYNGLPIGCVDDDFPWGREGPMLETKYPFVCHAELNAVLNGIGDLAGCSIYVVLFPCNECAKVIIQAGITTVFYLSDKYSETDQVKASKLLFEKAGVICKKLNLRKQKIILDFSIEPMAND